MTVQVGARPEPLTIDPAEAAVIVVDMLNDFAAPEGMFARAGIPIAAIRATVEPTSRVLAAARRAGMLVLYQKMEFASDLSNAGGPDAPNLTKHLPLGIGDRVQAPDGREGRILVEGTWNTEILSELTPHPGDLILSKHRYSGFYETPLDKVLRDAGIGTLVFTGCTTSVCVESTLRDAFYRDYRCLLLSDCTAEPIGGDTERSNHEASLLVVETLFGWVAESTALVQPLAELASVRA